MGIKLSKVNPPTLNNSVFLKGSYNSRTLLLPPTDNDYRPK